MALTNRAELSPFERGLILRDYCLDMYPVGSLVRKNSWAKDFAVVDKGGIFSDPKDPYLVVKNINGIPGTTGRWFALSVKKM